MGVGGGRDWDVENIDKFLTLHIKIPLQLLFYQKMYLSKIPTHFFKSHNSKVLSFPVNLTELEFIVGILDRS